ncbi:MAG: RHS repeat-associated core domain-containing protein [Pirellulaceae bacterium]
MHRWYDSKTGRWISEDPIGFAGGDANLTTYVGNATIDFVDPSGLAVGHHWIPREVFLALRNLLDEDALFFFDRFYTGELPYYHGYDTWVADGIDGFNRVKHSEYNSAVKELLTKFIDEFSRGKKLSVTLAADFGELISKGQVCNSKYRKFFEKNAKLFETAWAWRAGFVKSVEVATLFKMQDADLDAREIKSLVRKFVNGDNVKLSARAQKAWNAVAALEKSRLQRLLALSRRSSLKYFAGGLSVLLFVQNGVKGASGRGWYEGGGIKGAFFEIERDFVMADLVEEHVFSQVPEAAGFITDILDVNTSKAYGRFERYNIDTHGCRFRME